MATRRDGSTTDNRSTQHGQGNEMDAYLDAMKNYANFSGRTSRSQFWIFMLIMIVLIILSFIADAALFPYYLNGGPIRAAVTFAHLLPCWAVQVRRLHDTGRSGWWILISLTGVGAIVLFVFYCMQSTDGPNRLGANSANAPASPLNANSTGLSAATTLERLEKLSNLKSSGVLNDAEFQKMKTDVLNQSS